MSTNDLNLSYHFFFFLSLQNNIVFLCNIIIILLVSSPNTLDYMILLTVYQDRGYLEAYHLRKSRMKDFAAFFSFKDDFFNKRECHNIY